MTESLRITLIGGPTALLEMGGARLLTDPTFDAPGSYASGTVTLTKTTMPAVAAEAIGAIDAVLLSHDQHFDNLDRSGRAFLSQVARVATTVAGAWRLGGNARGLEPWDSFEIATPSGRTLRITATPARHGPVGIEPISGDVIGFVLAFSDEPRRAVYVSGDTVWYEGVAEVARRFDVRLAILFTGSAKPRGAFHMTMDANDAIEAAHAFKEAAVTAIHNEGWAHFTETQAELTQAFKAVGLGERLRLLEPGVALTLPI
ncbi:L-ascorbate metabolism protein UlaG, beta-lactamase superfamily [Rhizobiales bacterium GAS113]|nr:L-ascorbate metabolism protein UlaG, beta-lactamase superfamily [Rhizobiales bacterium GAS113]